MFLEICFWLSVHLFIRFPIACVPLASKPRGPWCMADVTLPRDKTGTLLPAVPGPRPATGFAQTSSSWAVEGSSPWPQLPQAHPCQAPQLLFLYSSGQMGEGFWSLRVQASDTGYQSNDTYGREYPYEPQFPGSFNWGKKSLWAEISSALWFQRQHFQRSSIFPL